MHVVQLGFQVDNLRRAPQDLLRDWYTIEYVAEAAAAAGNRVTVVQACFHRDHIRRGAVDYHFVPPDGANSFGGGEFAATVANADADVYHVHGLGFHDDVRALKARRPEIPILLQDHADRPPRPWQRARWRRGFAAVGGLAFCAREQAAPFSARGLLPPGLQVFEIAQWSAPFTPGDRDQARARTGLRGAPAVLWVGNLNDRKDPLTVLEAIRIAARELPGIELWCAFDTAPLLARVRARIDSDPVLRTRVHLLGHVKHEDMQELMRAADLFVLGSRSEGSGCALIEAMACGIPPVVTDIPSFRTLTGNGSVGRLWRPGDAEDCAAALCLTAAASAAESRAATLAHFEVTASPRALGRQLDGVYRRIRSAP